MRWLPLLVVVVVQAGCQCGPPAGDDDGGVDAGASADASVSFDGGSGSDAGPPNRLQLFGGGSFAARSCQQITVRAVGRTTTPVEVATPVTLDGGPWVEFFDGTDCNRPATTTVTLPAGQAEYQFRFRANAWGPLTATATSLLLDGGTMSFTSESDAVLDGVRAVVPQACFPLPALKTVVPFSTTEVPAAQPSRFVFITALPFGGGGADAGCTNSQFDVTLREGNARAEVFGFSSAAAGASQTLTLSPVVPSGVRFPTTTQRLTLFAQCLPAGEGCDGGVEACCGGACGAGICP